MVKYLWLLLFVSSVVFGQSKDATDAPPKKEKRSAKYRKRKRVQSDTLAFPSEDRVLDFNKGWKMTYEDSPAFKTADYDDAKWKNTYVNIPYLERKDVKSDTIGWFRKTIFIDSSAVNTPLLLFIRAAGAYEFYIDGDVKTTFGILKGKSTKTLINIPSKRVHHSFDRSGKHQLAFRFLFDATAKIDRDSDTTPLSFVIEQENEESLNEQKSSIAETSGIVVGLFLLAAIIHWFFFFNFKDERRDTYNLYMSIAMLLFALVIYLNSRSLNEYQLDWYIFRRASMSLIFIIGHGMLLISVNKYLSQDNSKLIAVAIVVSVCVGFILNFFMGSPYTTIGDIIVVALFVGVYVYLLVKANRQSVNSSNTLLKALGYFGASFLVFFFIITMYFSVTQDISSSTEIGEMLGPVFFVFFSAGPQLAVSFAISADLAREFVRTNVSLSNKIQEIEQLSAEKQDILARQNEVLEETVLQRTSELNRSLSDLKSTQAQLIQSEKLASLGELTAGIAHEIQNPLNFVNNFSEVSGELVDELEEELEKGDLEEVKFISSDLKSNLEKIHHHGKRASSIVKGMLEHSRMSTGEKSMTDINALADEYLRLAYHGLRAKDRTFNAKMDTHFDDSLPETNVVSQDIGRVFLNIINNAFQAPPPENAPEDYMKQVIVSTEQSGNQLVVKIADNGGGIPDELKEKIFQPFFTTKKTGEGTGLGLSLAYDIVTKGHGGNLTVESKKNEGTEFKILLPLN